MNRASVEQELVKLYEQHCPEKTANVPALLDKFAGREHELLSKVRRKYGLV
jgi:hypothetical protein